MCDGRGAQQRKRRSSYDDDTERLWCREMMKSRSRVAAGMWAQQESLDLEPDDSAAWLPAMEADTEQQERSTLILMFEGESVLLSGRGSRRGK
jgi:hypothetical protein